MKIHISKHTSRWWATWLWRTSAIMAVMLIPVTLWQVTAAPVYSESIAVALGGAEYNDWLGAFLALRNSFIIPLFFLAMVFMVVAAAGHYFKFGAKDMSVKDEADAIMWWSLTERANHAVMVVVFFILMFSGLTITFGKVLPSGVFVRGLHEISGFLFTPSLLIMLFLWAKEGVFKKFDLEWFRHMGGYLGEVSVELKASKFNAGQKLFYWVVIVCGALLSISGFAMFFELGNVVTQRFWVMLHFFSMIPIILMIFLHLYLTLFGVKGVLRGMIDGKFSLSAAKEYHPESEGLKDLK